MPDPSAESSRKPSVWLPIFGLWVLVRNAIGLMSRHGRWDVISSVVAVVCGLALILFFIRDERRHRTFLRSSDQYPLKRSAWEW